MAALQESRKSRLRRLKKCDSIFSSYLYVLPSSRSLEGFFPPPRRGRSLKSGRGGAFPSPSLWFAPLPARGGGEGGRHFVLRRRPEGGQSGRCASLARLRLRPWDVLGGAEEGAPAPAQPREGHPKPGPRRLFPAARGPHEPRANYLWGVSSYGFLLLTNYVVLLGYEKEWPTQDTKRGVEQTKPSAQKCSCHLFFSHAQPLQGTAVPCPQLSIKMSVLKYILSRVPD